MEQKYAIASLGYYSRMGDNATVFAPDFILLETGIDTLEEAEGKLEKYSTHMNEPIVINYFCRTKKQQRHV